MDRYQKEKKKRLTDCVILKCFQWFRSVGPLKTNGCHWKKKYQKSKHFDDRPVTQTAMFHNFCGQEIIFTKISAV